PTCALVRLCRPFFFQAEDGIRDRNVTGVQTCALPISKLEDMSRIYLDHAATTPVRDAALEAFVSQAKRHGNASALHSAGRSVKFHVEDARDRLAATLDADPTEILFTAGGTESDNLALKGL